MKPATVRLYVALISLVAAVLELVTALVRLVTTLPCGPPPSSDRARPPSRLSARTCGSSRHSPSAPIKEYASPPPSRAWAGPRRPSTGSSTASATASAENRSRRSSRRGSPAWRPDPIHDLHPHTFKENQNANQS